MGVVPQGVPDLDQNLSHIQKDGQTAADGDGRRDPDNGSDDQGEGEDGVEADDGPGEQVVDFLDHGDFSLGWDSERDALDDAAVDPPPAAVVELGGEASAAFRTIEP